MKGIKKKLCPIQRCNINEKRESDGATRLANYKRSQRPRSPHSQARAHSTAPPSFSPTPATLRGGRSKSRQSGRSKALENHRTAQPKARDWPRLSPPPSPRQQHALPTSSCDLHAAPALPLLGDSFQQPFCRELVVRAHSGAGRHEKPWPDFTGRTRASKERSGRGGWGEPHWTRRTPGRRGKLWVRLGLPLAGASTWRIAPHPLLPPYPQKHPDRLLTPRAKYTPLGAWRRPGRVATKAPARTCQGRPERTHAPLRSRVRESSRCWTTRLVIGCQVGSRVRLGPSPNR